MARRPNKYGSAYDPANKLTKPEKLEAKPEVAKLGAGCGDPGCARCYPETAGRVRPTGRTVDITSTPVSLGSIDLYARMREQMAEMLSRSYSAGFMPFDEAAKTTTARVAQPPASFTKARKDVKDWLIEAPGQAFDDIVGNEEALEQLRDAIQAPVKHKALYAAYGMKMPKGALLSGPPGCGKTMFARAAASEMKSLYGDGVEFICLSGAELQSMYVGETEGYIKSIFTFAREYRAWRKHPLLVFIDEAEVLFPDRTGRVRRVSPWEESQVATFLAEMDGVQESGAFVLLATNRPEVIDQALLRDGRCDFKIMVKRPNQAAVEAILRNNFRGTLIGADDRETLITAAAEALFDPHKVILEAHAIGIDLEKLKLTGAHHKHFLLEHIVSGAMAASIPARATRYAFARDKLDGVAKGVTVADVLRSVNDLFEENRRLDHAFAVEEFRQQFLEEVAAKERASGAR